MITVTLFCRKMSYVAIYALSGKKIIRQKFACVNILTNIMSDPSRHSLGEIYEWMEFSLIKKVLTHPPIHGHDNCCKV